MTSNNKIFKTGYDKQAFKFICNNSETYELARFLFSDFPVYHHAQDTTSYDFHIVDSKSTLSLRYEEKLLYSGTSRYLLCYTLMNEVLYHCINNDADNHALHAGAVCNNTTCIILPGKSGKGKSSLTAWLISRGYYYLTDELVFLDREGGVFPVTRPVSLKVDGKGIRQLFPKLSCNEVISGDEGSMIPHRLLNPDFETRQPELTHIVFPSFQDNSEIEFKQISPAQSTLYLIQCYVNARNLPEHGISELSSIVRRCHSYMLTYSNFKDLEPIFTSSSSRIP